ncbi:hypothetical protein IAR55_005633 [Kwoniella newhampshirensis]|uniref:Nodulin-like domain-containing protein n=1 Tax=Kwoniella newhampshirensis TaxID=1651941 RepID=A0AAW0YGE8_9TREE
MNPSSSSSSRPSQSRLHSQTRLIPNIKEGDRTSDRRGRMSIISGALNPFGKGWSGNDRKRLGVFAMSVIVGLASGSNYVYSAYAPQLASKLSISATTVNLIGLAGNFGVYMSGPVWGKIVDSRGQRIPLFLGGLCCLVGYFLVHSFYTRLIPIRPPYSTSSTPSNWRLSLLLFSMFLTGLGGSAGLASSVNAIAKSFPDKTRASATGAVLAGFGLSAFLFSTVGQWLYKGDAGNLLALLAGGTGIPMLIGGLLIRPVPPEGEVGVGYERIGQEEEDGGLGVTIQEAQDYDDTLSPVMSRSSSLELSRSRSPMARGRHPHPHAHFPSDLPSHSEIHTHSLPKPQGSHIRSQSLSSLPPTSLSHSPLDLFRALDFWILFVILALLCGTGLMYINNAGTVALALAREGQRKYDKEVVSGWQAKQVGLVSIWNCLGRILGGIYSDYCKTRFQVRRIWFLPIVCVLFTISQVAALGTIHVQSLWAVSTLLGLAYGSLFNVMPMLVLEWFGMKHFSQNWGWIAVSPVIGSNTFNLIFGKVYDAHTVGNIGTSDDMLATVRGLMKRGGMVLPDDGQHDCLVGEQCYGTAFKISTAGTLLALGLSVLAGIRRERLSRERRKAM